jgi:hypothetical protein
MIKAQAMVPESEVFYCQRGDPSLLHHGVTEVRPKCQVLNLLGAVSKQAFNVTGFKQKPPDKVANHGAPDLLLILAQYSVTLFRSIALCPGLLLGQMFYREIF